MRIEIGKSLDVAVTAQTALEWLERLNREGADVEIDASAVQRIDSAGAQLILSLEREARARTGSLRIVAASAEFESGTRRLGLPFEIQRGVA